MHFRRLENSTVLSAANNLKNSEHFPQRNLSIQLALRIDLVGSCRALDSNANERLLLENLLWSLPSI